MGSPQIAVTILFTLNISYDNYEIRDNNRMHLILAVGSYEIAVTIGDFAVTIGDFAVRCILLREERLHSISNGNRSK